MDRARLSDSHSAVVYLHGMPGSDEECALFGELPDRIFAPDRTQVPLDISALAQEIETRFPDQAIILVGFSMGAYVAIHLAIALGSRVDHIHLIAPAAPVTDDAMLALMAGGPIFRLARTSPLLFRAATRLQTMLAKIAPALMFRSLFASAKGEERLLAVDAGFERRWIAMAKHCLHGEASGYCSEILGYVGDWTLAPQQVAAPVTVWFGTADRLTPPELVETLISRLPHVVATHAIQNTGHYSTLKAALPKILAARG